MEKTRPAHVLGGQYETPEKIMGVFNESIMVKMEFEVTMSVCGERPGRVGPDNIYIKYLNTE